MTALKKTIALALAAGLGLALAACASAPPAKKDYPVSGKSYVIKGKRYHVLASAEGFVEEGRASWYGRKFHGRKTASGEVYNMHGLTAAHRVLPLGTWVEVTNLDNGRRVRVKVNDRGPFARNRVLDLSYGAARRLDMVGAGTARVKVEALGREGEQEVGGKRRPVLVQPRSYREGRFTVQVGAFKNRDNARRLAALLKRQYGAAQVQSFDRGDAVFYRVQVGDERSLGRALALENKLKRNGYPDCYVVAR